ncbi:dimethylsulfoniopropionate lyase [Pseudomonas sp. 21LCFQ010]|uniref:dimethylsulfonioproprionate lyase family protein n=1 Tax=Pseudomonas sp. 21LCFQ010 TaxID=2957506 RepID=UPI002096DB9E|nr:dimethylsulfonioproprionate lyase family protein [Pseudomonas sp. 21LCFQ010]MCO8162062.1 dimethylsulfoniopropionate lyase [Pseudomonas sp. 21LCFQ010]
MHDQQILTHATALTFAISRLLTGYQGERHAEQIKASGQLTADAQLSLARRPVPEQEDPGVIEHWLATSLALARHNPAVDHPLLDALQALLAHARWIKRSAAHGEDPAFVERHRHALLLGNGSPVACPTLTLGLAVMAPETRYPFHQHPPQEFYIVLSEGQWYRQGDGWWQPGMGGMLWNAPSVVHSMQSEDAPLLALWGLMH